jgi:squalene-associated FAD-dependent desaturase
LPGESFRAWLERHEQGEQVIEWFWAPLLVSTLNERLDRIDPVYARQVVVDGLLRNRDGYTIEIPRIPLGELYGTRLESWLAAQGVNLRLGTSVRSILLDEEGSARGAVLRDGTPIEADLVLLAVPFDRVRALLPAVAQARWPRLRAIELHEAVPITGIHLWFDRKVCPHTFALLLGRTVQWVFDHTAIRGENGAGQYLQLVVSASYELAPRAPAEIRDIALADLRALWPEAMANASLLRWRVITEHSATFSVRPGIQPARLPQRTPIDNLFLAGDWTDSGWPATMEGAVRSGYRAAEEMMRVLGRPTRFVVAELPTSGLARAILGPRDVRPFTLENLQPIDTPVVGSPAF